MKRKIGIDAKVRKSSAKIASHFSPPPAPMSIAVIERIKLLHRSLLGSQKPISLAFISLYTTERFLRRRS